MPEVQEKPLNELLSRSMIDLYVGPENTHWILHEKLLCHHSPFFRSKLLSKDSKSQSLGLPDEEDGPFRTFVAWLYSSSLPVPREENDLGVLFDLYLMAEKWGIASLVQDLLQVVREWYKFSDSYPGLRRVQYIYANTEDGSPMRHMLVHAVARLLVLEKGIPKHWDKALRKNGQLAVDIIAAIQDWRWDEDMVPDAREDPELAEDAVGIEGNEDGDVDGIAGRGGPTGGGERELEEHDDGEDTVVESPGAEAKMPKEIGEREKKKKQGDELPNGFQKLGLKEVPNGISNGDYGTLAQ